MKTIIESGGLKLEAAISGTNLQCKILAQDPSVRAKLRASDKAIRDDTTGIGLYSRRKPNFNKTSNVLFVRGDERGDDNKVINIPCESSQDAQNKLFGLMRLADKLNNLEERMEPLPGGTTDARMAIITKSQANILCLTGKRHYPDQRRWRRNTQPVRTDNAHYNEHIGQIVDVLNKAENPNHPVDGPDVVNAHKVGHAAALRSRDRVQRMFDEAEQAGNEDVIATWRILSGLRASDDLTAAADFNNDND